MAKRISHKVLKTEIIKNLSGAKCGKLDIATSLPSLYAQYSKKGLDPDWEEICQTVERLIRNGRLKITLGELSVTAFEEARSQVLSVEGYLRLQDNRKKKVTKRKL